MGRASQRREVRVQLRAQGLDPGEIERRVGEMLPVQPPPPPSGSAKTHQVQRRKLRRRLEAQGFAPEEVARRVEEMRKRQAAVRVTVAPPSPKRPKQAARPPKYVPAPPEVVLTDADRERIEAETYERLNLDDRGYRPRKPDPLLTGAARATGVAARAVRRRTAITQWQHDEAAQRPDGRVPR